MEDAVIAVSRKVIGLLVFTIISLSLVFMTAYTKYIFAQDYTFRIEATCNPQQQTCFVRDCTESCPPNQLPVYSAYKISASDYSECTTNGCENICQNEDKSNLCKEIVCNAQNGDSCSE